MAGYANIPSSSSGTYSSQSWINTQLARADTAIGTASGGYAWSDFVNSGDFVLGGTPTIATTLDGGVIQWGGSATNASVRLAGQIRTVSNHRTNLWYYACRVQFIDAPDSGVTTLFGFTDGSNNSAVIALNGGTSTTALVIQYFAGGIQGVNQPLSVSIGGGVTLGAWYDLALSFDGTTVIAWLNGVNVGQRTDTANIPAAGGFMSFESTPGAGLKRVEVDAFVVCWKRSP